MPPDNEFAALRRLLSLKRHEQPPPGYYESFRRQMIAELRIQPNFRRTPQGLEGVPGWIVSLLERVQARPGFAGLVGAGLCALVVGTVIFYEKDTRGPQPMPSVLAEITRAEQPASAQGSSPTVFEPVTAEATMPMLASNQWQSSQAPSLFDLTPGLQTAPVSLGR